MLDTRDPAHSPTERVRIRLNNGKVLDSGLVASIRGHADDPMSAAELLAKFIECKARTYAEPEARRLFELLQAVEELPSARDLPTCKTTFSP